ncbi:MAG: hypothetical protein L0Y79_05395 [Chlorobi bacterium]|nr:hypothetical protein [Chlorobiota bacterium]MCI0714999.1 hypothetical protein [Chlorobiota bacterium]
MKKYITITFILVISLMMFAFKDKDRSPNERDNITPPYQLAITNATLDANTIDTWFRTNGSFNYNPVNTNLPGFEWPKESGLFARFASGLWLGAKVGNDTLVVITEYAFEFLNGYTDNNGQPQGKDNPAYRIYKLIKGVNNEDRQQWPNALLGNSDQGAPVYFDSASNSWKPLDLGDQTVFCRYTDSYPVSHTVQNGSTVPLKADIINTNFAFDVNGPLGQIAFSEFKIINRSNNVWTDVYLTAWSDDDLGYALDDKVGVDTSAGLGYTYNGDNDDPDYGPKPPAVGFDFFRGAALFTGLQQDIDTLCRGTEKQIRVGYRQLGMNVFNWFSNTIHPVNGNPSTFRESYRYMSGWRRDGSPTINPVTNQQTTFMFSGDPVENTGWIQSGIDDQRFMQSTGPFVMNPGDTQIVVIAQIIARGSSNINSVKTLKIYDGVAQKIYNNCFQVPASTPIPIVNYFAPGNGKIYLSWDDRAERTLIRNNLSGGFYKFQGYNIYQVRTGTNGTDKADRELIATFDVKDTIFDIEDSVIADEYGGSWIYTVVQPGSDNGISRYIVIDKDKFTDQSLINGTPYSYTVTAYSYDSLSGPFRSATARVNESSYAGGLITIIPQNLVQGTEVFYNVGDTVNTSRRDLGAIPIVIEPLNIIDAVYRTTYSQVNNNLVWTLTRTIGGSTSTLVQNNADFTGSQDTAKIRDGLMFVHQNVGVVHRGVVRDPDDQMGDTSNLQTKLRGWQYNPPQNQWVQGVDTTVIKTAKLFTNRQFESWSMGISFPTNTTFRGINTKISATGTQFTPVNGILNGGPLRKIKFVFGNTQKAYRYASVEGNILLGDTGRINNTPYKDYVDVPFQVFAIDELDSSGGTPRQLNVAFVDADDNGLWDPDTSKLGKYQILYVFASTYDPNPNTVYTLKNIGFGAPGFGAMDIMYAWVPRVKKVNGVPLTYTAGDELIIYPYTITRAEFVPGRPVYYQWTTRGSIIGNSSIASNRSDMDKVKVFPNPYYGQSRLEINPVNRFVYFSNLPKECTIYIYSLNGVLVRKIQRNSTDPKNSLERWNLRNQDDIPVASGMYIALVDAPGIGTKVLKLAIFTPEERIDTF